VHTRYIAGSRIRVKNTRPQHDIKLRGHHREKGKGDKRDERSGRAKGERGGTGQGKRKNGGMCERTEDRIGEVAKREKDTGLKTKKV